VTDSRDYTTIAPHQGGPVLFDHHLSATHPLWAVHAMDRLPSPLELHVHRGVEVGVVLAGLHEISFDDIVLPLRPGQAWLAAMWEPHGWRCVTGGTETVVVVFLPELLGDEMLGDLPWLSLFAPQPLYRPLAADQALRTKMLALGQLLAQEVRYRPVGWEAAIRHFLLVMLLHLRRGWEPSAAPGGQSHPDRLSTGDLHRVMPALDLLHRDPARHLAASQAARACALSRSRFDVIFKRTMGLTFGAFRERTHLAVAAQQLLTTDASIEQIAERAGFVDRSHLHRRFVKRYGCTPAEYRKTRGMRRAHADEHGGVLS
jgi:AraC-like DNA-binding protein